jgi:hypothetical protein
MTTEKSPTKSKKPARAVESITVYVPVELRRKLEELAERESRALSGQCLFLLRKGVSNLASEEPFAAQKV